MCGASGSGSTIAGAFGVIVLVLNPCGRSRFLLSRKLLTGARARVFAGATSEGFGAVQNLVKVGEAVTPGMRAKLLEGVRLWGAVSISRNDAVSRQQRLGMRALAEVYGIALTDNNDRGPGGPLTAGELASLPALRRQIRANHRFGIWTFRAGRALRQFLDFALFASRSIAISLLEGPALKALAVVGGLYVLFGLGWDFGLAFRVAAHAVGWTQLHPDVVSGELKLAARIAFFFAVYMLTMVYLVYPYLLEPSGTALVALWRWRKKPAPPAAPIVKAPVQRPYEIENFSERSAFGDASLAQKNQIARALQGNGGGFAPKFEE
jgi:hypothetical protein